MNLEFDKKAVSYGKIGIFGILVLGFILILLFGIYFFLNNQLSEKDINGNFIVNDSDGILIKQENGVKTYYLGNGQFKDVIPSVSAQASPPPGTLVDPPVYPNVMGTVWSGSGNFYGTNTIGRGNAFDGMGRGYITFPLTNLTTGYNITNATLFYYVQSTSYTASDSIEIRKIDEVVNGFSNISHIFQNITRIGVNRSYGIATGTNVSTTGWKNITLNGNFTSDAQNALRNLTMISIGINGSDEATTNKNVVIAYNVSRPYIELTYTTGGSDSAVSLNSYYDGFVSANGLVNNNQSTYIEIGKPTSGLGSSDQAGFLTFNTSSIPDTANISNIFIRINVTSISDGGIELLPEHYILFQSLNGTCVNTTTHSNITKAISLYNNITSGQLYGNNIEAIGQGLADSPLVFVLGIFTNSTYHLQGMLPSDCFSVGIEGFGSLTSNLPGDTTLRISSSEGNFSPQLSVIYTVPEDCTSVPGSGDWTISTYCLINNQQSIVNGNLVIQNGGFFNMTGTTNITFNGSNRYIYVSSGGQINLYNTAGFNKK